MNPQPDREVVVLLRRPPDHPRTAQGLRAAVGYLTAGLRVTVVLCGPARQVLAQDAARPAGPPALRRPVETLRALGHRVIAADDDLPHLLRRAHAVVAW